jgi:hypothetical protein
MKRAIGSIATAGAKPGVIVTLNDEVSLWRSDIYLEVAKDVPGVETKAFVESEGESLKKLYFYYTSFPTCAEKCDKDYAVVPAQV